MVALLLVALALQAPPFAHSRLAGDAAQLPHSWHRGCPVAPAQLRRLRLTYWGFDGRAHTGALIVNAERCRRWRAVFSRLYAARFPIRRMRPIDAYGGSDERSLDADNTAAFNCRYAVASGPKRWSVHAYGQAVDVNPVENPYLEGGRVHPRAGRAYLDRSRVRPGMAVRGGLLVRAFAAVGWQWGGRWTGLARLPALLGYRRLKALDCSMTEPPVDPGGTREAPTVDGDGRKRRRIDGVVSARLNPHVDHRGSLFEIVNFDHPFWEEPVVYAYAVTIRPGRIKGWGMHKLQTDRYLVVHGSVRVALYDGRAGSATQGLVEVHYLTETLPSLLLDPARCLARRPELGRRRRADRQLPDAAVRPRVARQVPDRPALRRDPVRLVAAGRLVHTGRDCRGLAGAGRRSRAASPCRRRGCRRGA